MRTRADSNNRENRSSLSNPLLDTEAVAKALGVTPRHVRRLVSERRIPFVKVGRFVRFEPGALDVWLDQQRVEVRMSLPAGYR